MCAADRRLLTLLLLVALAVTGCDGGAQVLAADEIGTDEVALRPPPGWQAQRHDHDEVALIGKDPQRELGRFAAFRVEGLNDAGLYVADMSTIGAALRGLEPDLLREEPVQVDGAVEARLVEFVYTAQVDGRPRLHTLQLVVRRADDLGFDIRVELPEAEWDAGLAADVIASVRLLDPPR